MSVRLIGECPRELRPSRAPGEPVFSPHRQAVVEVSGRSWGSHCLRVWCASCSSLAFLVPCRVLCCFAAHLGLALLCWGATGDCPALSSVVPHLRTPLRKAESRVSFFLQTWVREVSKLFSHIKKLWSQFFSCSLTFLKLKIIFLRALSSYRLAHLISLSWSSRTFWLLLETMLKKMLTPDYFFPWAWS